MANELEYDVGLVVESLKVKLADSMTEAATLNAIIQSQMAKEQELTAKIQELTQKIEECEENGGHVTNDADVIDLEEKKAEREVPQEPA